MVALPLLLSSVLLMAFNPSTYTYNNALPSRVYFTQSLGNVVGYEYDTSRDYAIDHDETFHAYYGYAYVPFYVDISYSESGYSIDFVQCVTIRNPEMSVLDENVPYYFWIETAGNDWYVREKSYSVCAGASANLFNTPFTSHTTSYFHYGGFIRTSTFYVNASTSSLSQYAYIDGDTWLDTFEPFCWSYISSLSKTYAAALSNSYNKGYDEGKSDGIDIGRNDAIETTPGNVFSDLVTSILDVPLSILGGLSVFAIFDTPIISVIVSFLLLAIVLLIIKRFL